MLILAPDHCPECDTPIHPGLFPDRCPECRFPFDHHTRVFRPRRPAVAMLALAVGAACWVAFIAALERILVGGYSIGIWEVLITTVALLSGWYLAPRVRGFFSPQGRYVALTPAGVIARTLRGWLHVPWTRQPVAGVRFGIPLLRWRGRSRAAPLDWIFDSDREVKAFLNELERGRDRYANLELREVQAGTRSPHQLREPPP